MAGGMSALKSKRLPTISARDLKADRLVGEISDRLHPLPIGWDD